MGHEGVREIMGLVPTTLAVRRSPQGTTIHHTPTTKQTSSLFSIPPGVPDSRAVGNTPATRLQHLHNQNVPLALNDVFIPHFGQNYRTASRLQRSLLALLIW